MTAMRSPILTTGLQGQQSLCGSTRTSPLAPLVGPYSLLATPLSGPPAEIDSNLAPERAPRIVEPHREAYLLPYYMAPPPPSKVGTRIGLFGYAPGDRSE